MKTFFILIFAAIFVLGKFDVRAQEKPKEQNQSKTANLLIDYERRMWEMYKNKDSKSLEPLVAEDFYDIYLSGRVVRRKEWFEDMRATDILDYSLTDFNVVALNKNSAIVVYTAESHGRQNGYVGFNRVWVTSGWAKRGKNWTNVFYRESRIPEPTKKQ